MGCKLPCPNEVNPDKLSLALEPEVAAIYSQQVTEKEVVEAGTSFQKPKGNYMVLDIGGGTVMENLFLVKIGPRSNFCMQNLDLGPIYAS